VRELAWAVTVGMIEGRGTPGGINYLRPGESITRAEGAAFIARYRRTYMMDTFILPRDGSLNHSAARHTMLSFDLGGTENHPTYPASVDPTRVLIADNIYGFLWWFRGGELYEGPIREDYQFGGWYLDPTFLVPLTDEAIVPSTEFTLYARWKGGEPGLPPVYLGYLYNAITEAESREQQNYTPRSWESLQHDLASARAIWGDPYSTQIQVDVATHNLLEAIKALEPSEGRPPINLGYLSAAITEAESHVQQNYTPESWVSLQTYLAAARTVYGNLQSTQLQVDTATESLLAAIKALEPAINLPPTYRGYLNAAITEAESHSQPNYTPVSWANMQTQLTAARAVYNNQHATQLQIDTATDNLLAAIEALEPNINLPPILTGIVSTAPWSLYADGTLIIEPGHIQWWEPAVDGMQLSPWHAYRNDILRIVFTGPVTVGTSLRGLFSGLSEVVTIEGLHYLDTTNVTNMGWMFYGTSSLQYLDLPETWVTSNVFHLYRKFHGASSLESITGLDSWDTSNVVSIGRLFHGASSITNLDGISGWDTGKVADMRTVFQNTASLSQLDLSGWRTGNVTMMNDMFNGSSNLTSVGDLSGWDTGNVISMYSMFRGTHSLVNLDSISSWDTRSVTGIARMFHDARSLTRLDLSNWDTRNITDMRTVFQNASSLQSLNLSGWDTSNVQPDRMPNMFIGASSLTELTLGENFKFHLASPGPGLRPGAWQNAGTGAVPAGTYVLSTAELMAHQNASPMRDKWVWVGQTPPLLVNRDALLAAITEAESRDQANYPNHNWHDFQRILDEAISIRDNPNATQQQVDSAAFMLWFSIETLSWELQGPEPCPPPQGIIYTSQWVIYPEDTLTIYPGAITWNSPTSPWEDYSYSIRHIVIEGPIIAGPYLRGLFAGLINVTTITGLEYFDTSNVTNMAHMFHNARSLESLDLSGWDTRNVTNMTNMFLFAEPPFMSHIQEITLGQNFRFVGNHSLRPGPWQNTGNVDAMLQWQMVFDLISHHNANPTECTWARLDFTGSECEEPEEPEEP